MTTARRAALVAALVATTLYGQTGPCEGDANGDGAVDPLDSGFVLARFGCTYPDDGINCLNADVNGDGNVDPLDSGFVLARFGPCEAPPLVLIPGGEFEMGCHAETGETCYSDELPVHTVYVDSFYMDVYEVTNQRYADYLNSAYSQELIEVIGGVVYKAGDSEAYCDTYSADDDSRIHWDGSTFTVTAGKEDHPMLEESWYGAAAYANWRSEQDGRTPCYDLESWECDFDANGYRLPTEAEWEYAARGDEYDPYYAYPWGNTIDGSNANYGGSGDPYETGDYPWTTPVGYYDGGQTPPGVDMANGYGLYDVSGNVYEWCNDWYDLDYYDSSPYDNPQGPASGTYRVVRGGSWDNAPSNCRSANRDGSTPGNRHTDFGFRVASGTP